jgi:hypothetical protein
VKLLNVGFLTKSFGGNIKISDNGLNALLIINIIGYAVKIPKINSVNNKTTSPPIDLFNL